MLLGVRPALQLSFAGNGFDFGSKVLMVHKFYRPPTCSPRRAFALIVNSDSLFEIGGVSDVKTSIGAAEDVNEKGICGRRCGMKCAHSMRFAYSGHSTRCLLSSNGPPVRNTVVLFALGLP